MFQSSCFVRLMSTLLSLAPGTLALGQVAELPDGAGKELVEGACLTCHGHHLDRIYP